MSSKYFIKEKCPNLCNPLDTRKCEYGCNKGFIKGADVTEWITGLLEKIDKSFTFKCGCCKDEGTISKTKQLIFKGLIVERE